MDTESVARAIWQAQRSKIKSNDGINSRLSWRSSGAPLQFWDSFVDDARAAIQALQSIGWGKLDALSCCCTSTHSGNS